MLAKRQVFRRLRQASIDHKTGNSWHQQRLTFCNLDTQHDTYSAIDKATVVAKILLVVRSYLINQ